MLNCLQETVLDEVSAAHLYSYFWIKADGCDIVKGLNESVSGNWNGDVDLNDGKLQLQFDKYQQKLKFVENIGLPPCHKKEQVSLDLHVENEIVLDVSFITKGFKT